MSEAVRRERFEQAVLPHLDTAYNLARWLTRNEQDAQDVTQEAFLRAFRFFAGYQGGNMRAWLLTIVRNTCNTWIQRNRRADRTDLFDEEIHSMAFSAGADPETQVLAGADRESLRRAIEDLPDVFRRPWCYARWKGCPTKRLPTSLPCRWAR